VKIKTIILALCLAASASAAENIMNKIADKIVQHMDAHPELWTVEGDGAKANFSGTVVVVSAVGPFIEGCQATITLSWDAAVGLKNRIANLAKWEAERLRERAAKQLRLAEWLEKEFGA
jgi:hypothetical protein